MSRTIARLLLLLLVTILPGACKTEAPSNTSTSNVAPSPQAEPTGVKNFQIKLTSTAFQDGGMIPQEYTCDGPNLSPPLSWTGLPGGTKSLALIMDDPDAPGKTWVHWVLYRISPVSDGLPKMMNATDTMGNFGRHGINDFGKMTYGGPCPPSGTHRYFFKLYALDTEISLNEGATKEQLLKAMEGHILAEGQLMGRYKR